MLLGCSTVCWGGVGGNRPVIYHVTICCEIVAVCFWPQKALRPDMGYNTLANFRIEKKIGRGQFSEVYRATCLLDGMPVALKKVQVRMTSVIPHLFNAWLNLYPAFHNCCCPNEFNNITSIPHEEFSS